MLLPPRERAKRQQHILLLRSENDQAFAAVSPHPFAFLGCRSRWDFVSQTAIGRVPRTCASDVGWDAPSNGSSEVTPLGSARTAARKAGYALAEESDVRLR